MKKYFLLFLFLPFSVHAKEARVVVSFKPLHSLVASVMEGDAEPALLIKGAHSPHEFSLQPSQVKLVQRADIIFYIGDGFEHFLSPVLANAPSGLQRVAMSDTPDLTLLPVRPRGVWAYEEDHEHGHGHDHGDSGGIDMHFWLIPANAIRMVARIEEVLSKHTPEKSAVYHRNAQVLIVKLQALDKELSGRMKKLQHQPFLTFHDATQYYENAYGLTALAAVTSSPEMLTGARHISELRELIRAQNVRCVFSEPEFEPRLMANIVKDTQARIVVLDPEATQLTPGKDLYVDFLKRLADGFESCLSPS